MTLAEKYKTVSQVAELLGVTNQTVYGWVHRSEIESESIGGMRLIPQSAIEALQSDDRYWQTTHGKNMLATARFVADGMTNAEIAYELNVTRGTVEKRLFQLSKRQNLRNRAHLAAWYVREHEERA